MKRLSLDINNWLLRVRRKKYTPQELMLLLPRCLQNSECVQNIVEDTNNCQLCGKCPIVAIVTLGKEYDIRVVVATGGLMAREYVKQYKPRLIIAVACENELLDGIMKVFPSPVYALINHRPHGPCKNTHIEPDDVREAIERFVQK